MTKASLNAEKAARVAAAEVAVEAPRTDWDVFVSMGLVPTSITCSEYWPVQPATTGCHSRLQLTASALENHIQQDHGGCYFVEVEFSDSEAGWPGWKELAAKGLQLEDFRCDLCQEELIPSTQTILKHLKVHPDSNGRRKDNNAFRMKLVR